MRKIEDLKFLIPQINFRVGDIDYNLSQIIDSIKDGESNNVDFILYPELALSGYPPRDILYYDRFLNQIQFSIDKIINSITNTHVILGLPVKDKNNILRNAAIVLNKNGIVHTYYKILLPDYNVFDETRYFLSGDNPSIFKYNDIKIGLQICEDAWDHLPNHQIQVTKNQFDLGADLIINISASPYTVNKPNERLDLIKSHVKNIKIPIIYVNLLGCQDDLVFDGRSFVVNKNGELIFSTDPFEPRFYYFSLNQETKNDSSYVSSKYKEIFSAITLNLQDYLIKSNLSKNVIVALSGGIDSAVTLVLCVKSLGPENVTAIYLPSKFSDSNNLKYSKELCENLGIKLLATNIEDMRNILTNQLKHDFNLNSEWNIADENIQSRIRSLIMMYYSNSTNSILISTGNKSEIATGYCTLYGDTSGGKNLIGDLYKTEVYELAKYINKFSMIIPSFIIERPPSAELKDNQFDLDSLPPYQLLDEILYLIIEEYNDQSKLIKQGYDKLLVEKIMSLVINNEFKRKQFPQSIKLSDVAFGFGRRFPTANKFIP